MAGLKSREPTKVRHRCDSLTYHSGRSKLKVVPTRKLYDWYRISFQWEPLETPARENEWLPCRQARGSTLRPQTFVDFLLARCYAREATDEQRHISASREVALCPLKHSCNLSWRARARESRG